MNVSFCQHCNKKFDQTLHIGDLENDSIACPHCGGRRLIRKEAASPPVTSKKSTRTISPNHPLRQLFADLVGRELIWDREVAAYVSELLIDFVHVDNCYRVRNYRGKRLEEVGE